MKDGESSDDDRRSCDRARRGPTRAIAMAQSTIGTSVDGLMLEKLPLDRFLCGLHKTNEFWLHCSSRF